MPNTQIKQPMLKNAAATPKSKPNEHGSIVVQAHFKIFDPQTKKVYVEGRA
jgi:hypothetical protein